LKYIPERVQRAAEAHLSMFMDTNPLWPDRIKRL
jgi:hypothetical protein